MDERQASMQPLIVRRRLLVRGIVQGVGFRPFVYSQASAYDLAGWVYNHSDGVTIEIEGRPSAVDAFERALYRHAPPLARIDSVTSEPLPPQGDHAFVIRESARGAVRRTLIAPDTATCPDCLHELHDPADRRFLYPFINCTNCGPRFTIIQDVPYDRANTTMHTFPMCPACQQEYDNPLDRRFHAQPNACPDCGPRVQLVDATTTTSPVVLAESGAAITAAAQLLANGAILGVKGLGGYHLVCHALDTVAVQRLRQRKQREAKPFAVMLPNLTTIRRYCHLSEAEAALLTSNQRPIVLLQQRSDFSTAERLAPDVAPVYTTLGVMLPYTPLHTLLLEAVATAAPERPPVLVMTSGNLSDEPIAYHDDDALARLSTIAAHFLLHNRPIHMRCDDSVTRITLGDVQMLRRARGYAPQPITLAAPVARPILACGGHYKNSFCLVRDQQAFVSQHVGDLENLETLTSFQESITHFQRLFDITPEIIAYDLHPDYLATRYALASAIPQKIGVQHHHAHIASVMVEHGLTEPVIGIAADGTGYGTDGAIWGGEILISTLQDFERVMHLNYVPLPGGAQAIRQPWRMAAVYLWQTYGDDWLNLPLPFVRNLDQARWQVLAQMIRRGLNAPQTSSMGRLFDAVAALVGLRAEALYEGQAAIELEMAADQHTSGSYPYHIQPSAAGQPVTLETAAMIRAIVQDIQHRASVAQISQRFHTTIALMLTETCLLIRARTGLQAVALSGGVFQNQLLLELLTHQLIAQQFQVYLNRQVPPNDGGLALGQAVIAAHVAATRPAGQV